VGGMSARSSTCPVVSAVPKAEGSLDKNAPHGANKDVGRCSWDGRGPRHSPWSTPPEARVGLAWPAARQDGTTHQRLTSAKEEGREGIDSLRRTPGNVTRTESHRTDDSAVEVCRRDLAATQSARRHPGASAPRRRPNRSTLTSVMLDEEPASSIEAGSCFV